MFENGLITPLLFVIGAILLGYTLMTIAEQRRSMVFQIERGAWSYVLAVVLVVVGIGNFFLNGQGLQEIAIGFVTFSFAIFIAVVRNGVGRKAIYLDGVRYMWSKVSAVKLRKDHGVPVLYFTIKDIERVIYLRGSDYKDVQRFVNELKQAYGL